MTTTESRAGRPLLDFDELSKGVAAGTISRRKALALAGGAVVSAALMPFAGPAEARRGRRNRCKGKPDLCRSMSKESLCSRSGECACIRRKSDGRRICADLSNAECPTTDECDNNNECPGRQICVEIERCCGSQRNLCVPKCGRGKRAGKRGAAFLG